MSPARLRRLAPIALVALLAASCGDNEESAGTTTTPGPPLAAAPPADTTAATGQRPRGNSLLVGTQDIYPLLGGNLTDLAPNQVFGYSTRVIALAGPDGFWAGRSERQRILVKLRLKGQKAPRIRIGQKADFIGMMLTATRAQQQGLDAAGRALLEKQGVYVDASIGDLDLR